MILTDSYGDGWMGNILTINNDEYTLDPQNGFGDPLGYYDIITVGDCAIGCTDPFAFNYNPIANSDDGSCSYECEEGVVISCGGGEYEQEVGWEIQDCFGTTIVSADAPFGAPYLECLDVDLPDNYVVIMTDSYGDGWTGNMLIINNEEYTLDPQNGFGDPIGFNDIITVGNCSAGCLDVNASNFCEEECGVSNNSV